MEIGDWRFGIPSQRLYVDGRDGGVGVGVGIGWLDDLGFV